MASRDLDKDTPAINCEEEKERTLGGLIDQSISSTSSIAQCHRKLQILKSCNTKKYSNLIFSKDDSTLYY